MLDNSNKVIDIDCGGFYQLTDYYVIITKNIIPKSASPLKLSIKFEGRFFQSDQGIFDISYTGGKSRYVNLLLLLLLSFLNPTIFYLTTQAYFKNIIYWFLIP